MTFTIPLHPSLDGYLRLARLDRPTGAWLLLLPCWWGMAFGSAPWPDPWLMALFALGALIMRGAGCAYNDVVDQNIDGQVERTKTRPIAEGLISPLRGLLFVGFLSLLGLGVLLQFSLDVVYGGILSLGLVALYPWMKRITHWPQLFLGLTFNWGIWLGWMATAGTLTATPLFLYLAGVCWTLSYDTIYAHQDKEDDMRIGVKSTALLWGKKTKPFLWAMNGSMLVLLALAGRDLGWGYGVLLLGMACHMGWQIMTLDMENPQNCWVRFRSNGGLGLFFFIGVVFLKVIV